MKTCYIEPHYGNDEYGCRVLESYTAWDTTYAANGEDDVIEMYTSQSKMPLIVDDLKAQGFTVETRQELKERIKIAEKVLLDRIAEAQTDQRKLQLALSEAVKHANSRWGKLL